MHQPLYREPAGGAYLMPWVRLHATRAYNDMAWVLARHERARCTVNFTPVLLEQLDDYAAGRARDRMLELSARSPADLGPAEREQLLAAFFMVSWDRSIRPVPRYWDLLEKRGLELARVDLPRVARTFDDGELQDLQALFNLAWMGFAALEEDEGLRDLARKERDYTRADVDYVLAAQRRIVEGIVPAWRALADRGQVELSTTPYFHPILPLVLDSDAASRALPGVPLPPRFAWTEDARWHVRAALDAHERRFGRPAAGMWPAEGSVSPEAVRLLAEEGVAWAASDEGVLLRSLPPGSSRVASLLRPWRVDAGDGRELPMLFRDRGLADLVGFSYARAPAAEAVADLLGRLRATGEAWRREGQEGPATIGVFLDGENAWEHYPRSGRDFLDGLYAALEADPRIQTVTMSEATASPPGPTLRGIHSGSWIEASFRIWIGHREDRLAWTALQRAREAVEAARGGLPPATVEAALGHLRAAEGSDWYWWYGEDFATEQAAEFDALFRGHVARACALVGAPVPFEVQRPIKALGGGLEAKPLREPSLLVRPVVDGRDPTYFEWNGAGCYRPRQQQGSMFGGAHAFRELWYGFDEERLYLRLDPAEAPARAAEVADRVRVAMAGPRAQLRADFDLVPDGTLRPGRREEGGGDLGRGAFLQILELEIPFAEVGLRAGDEIAIAVEVTRGPVELERLPRSGYLTVVVPGPDFERVHWRV
jgi:alpha-amylase/alpha-mannosidase (GH57 family)